MNHQVAFDNWCDLVAALVQRSGPTFPHRMLFDDLSRSLGGRPSLNWMTLDGMRGAETTDEDPGEPICGSPRS